MTPKTFPKISDDEMRRMLTPARGPVRLVIDTDAKNEIDDQFALAWALLSQDVLQIEAVYAAPFSSAYRKDSFLRAYELLHAGKEQDLGALKKHAGLIHRLERAGINPKALRFDGPDVGMEHSYEEILLVFEKLGLNPDELVFRGSDRYLSSLSEPVQSPAAEDLVARALQNDYGPLYVVAIGCPTNVASALLMEPAIIHNVVVVWTAGYPTPVDIPSPSLNMEQDMLASQLLFDSGVPHVYLPGFHVGAQLRLSIPEMEAWVRGKGAIGDYLYSIFLTNPVFGQPGPADHFGRTRIIWDLICIAWLLNPDWVPSRLVRAPGLGDDTTWQRDLPGRHLMREAYDVNRDAIFLDFLHKLEQAP